MNSRKEKKNADKQLQKGKKFFTEILSPLVGLSSAWSHRGLVCFPHIESRDDLRVNGVSIKEIKVSSFTIENEIPS